MENVHGALGEISNGSTVERKGDDEGTRYARFTKEQIEVLEKVYAECASGNQSQLSRILCEEPVLSGIAEKQLRIWFQNRRCRDRQKRETEELARENKRLATGYNMLREKNNSLKRQIDQITIENEYLQNQLTSRMTNSGMSRQPVPVASQWSSTISDNKQSLHSLVEETKNEFLRKAIGTAINWNPMPRLMKLLGRGSPCEVDISSACIGVAVRACTVLPLKPTKVIEILKNRLSWSWDCRSMNVIARYPSVNGGTVEIIYTQYYAPTTLACARYFWTMRYSAILDDGSLLVCEKSVYGSENIPSSPVALEFVRGKMLASGYLVRSCDGRSTIILVDHFDWEAWSVPELVRPLYTSPEIVAERMTLPALRYLQQLANKRDEKLVVGRLRPNILRSFNKRVSKGFNDAVSCLMEDGWRWMSSDGSNDVHVSVKQTNPGSNAMDDGVICMRTSLILENISPPSLVRLLKDRRSSWMNFNFADHFTTFSEAAHRAYPGFDTHNLSKEAVTLNHTEIENETFDVIRFEQYHKLQSHIHPRDIYFMQISKGMEDTGFGACSELIFAPIDKNTPSDAVLLCSGFRIYLLSSNTSSANILASNEASSSDVQLSSGTTSLLILAFQFPSGAHIQEQVAITARKYVQHVMSAVKNLALEIDALPSKSKSGRRNCAEVNPARSLKATPEPNRDVDLATLISESCRSMLGVDMLGPNCPNTDSVSQCIHNHQDAVICFSFSSTPVILYANQAGLDMLGTTADKLQLFSVDRIIGSSYGAAMSLASILPTVMELGFAILGSGCYISEMNNCVVYDESVVWQVRLFDGSIHCLAAAFTDCMPFL